jgi:peroxiredoxin (alkyl hydroperoxide reductase subunit C)
MESTGTAAPFSLLDQHGQRRSLREFQGRIVVLAFYPADWTPVCSSELALFQEVIDEIHAHGAEIVAISTDTPHSHRVWAESQHLTFPVLSDFWPHGATARAYGVFREDDGTSQRALFFIDGTGAVRDRWIAPHQDVAPGLNLVLETLEQITGRSAAAGAEEHHA